MFELLPAAVGPRLIQRTGTPRKAAFDACDHLLVVLPEKPRAEHWNALPEGKRLRTVARRAGPSQPARGRLANTRATGVTLGLLPENAGDRFTLLKFAGELLAAARQDHPLRIGLLLPGHRESSAQSICEALLLAAHAQDFAMPTLRATIKTPKPRNIRSITLLGQAAPLDLAATEIAARAQNLARWLTALPPSHLNAGSYRQLVGQLAKAHGWHMEFMDEARLRKLGAGAFLAVSQGNADRDAGIIRLQYRPKAADGKQAVNKARPVALVGKGILFDTGGNNLKTHKSMLDMHEDMAGSAVALASLQALTELEYPQPVDCWLAVTENRVSATAYKSRDVVTASNGLTIEVIHTDAEGRMVLADTLALAGRDQPALIIDYATLTGACVYALTERYSGIFSNRPDLLPAATDAGRRCGERVWPFPMDADFDEDLKSGIADVLQCSVDGTGDHILAARFLQRFVPPKSAWLHVDLSSASRKQGLGQVPGGPTGFGVRFTLELLSDHDRLTTALADSQA